MMQARQYDNQSYKFNDNYRANSHHHQSPHHPPQSAPPSSYSRGGNRMQDHHGGKPPYSDGHGQYGSSAGYGGHPDYNNFPNQGYPVQNYHGYDNQGLYQQQQSQPPNYGGSSGYDNAGYGQRSYPPVQGAPNSSGYSDHTYPPAYDQGSRGYSATSHHSQTERRSDYYTGTRSDNRVMVGGNSRDDNYSRYSDNKDVREVHSDRYGGGSYTNSRYSGKDEHYDYDRGYYGKGAKIPKNMA